MCGIAGIISPYLSDHKRLATMTDALSHRGPDNRGFFQDDIVSLGHRRLSIIDLSVEANQPMSNEDGTIHLICNGEIYNYKEKTIEMKAKGHSFRSKSDCEVLLHLYEECGDNFLKDVNGMYAFALWDSRKKRLLLAVDRFGKKPLYYAVSDNRIIFASELKSLLFFEWVSKNIDYTAVDRYLSLRYIPAPMTCFRAVKKLEQSTIMIWENGNIALKRYWIPKPNKICNFNSDEYIEHFRELLTDAVKLRLQSDVPLGIYLSGGVDSSAIAGLMKLLTGGRKVSYTASFEYKHDEHNRAQGVAAYLDYEYNRVKVVKDDFSFMPSIMYHLDEPFGDLLCLPAFMLAKKAKEKLTVVLTGDGADEILNGYFHQKLMLLRQKHNAILGMPGIETVLSGFSKAIPSSFLNMFFDYPDRFGPREKIKLSHALSGCSSFGSFYDGVTSCFTVQDKAGLYADSFVSRMQHETLAEEYQREIQNSGDFSFSSKLSLLDIKYWIPFSVIYRLDKMNMAHAVETRSPFLDFRVVEYALNLPDSLKVSKRRNKEILRCLIEQLYPPSYREKGKQAFYVPMVSQYENKFKEWASDLLTPETVGRRGLFKWPYVEKLFELSNKKSMLANRQVTVLAMLELWFRVFCDGTFKGEDVKQ
ncbi:MAG: asparagine synthase (glutamine-hydrolyzing) [Candidatus Omnitrophica bacterium]|nr:asparagine synthase (glutamine-hydrolyzing) [Candidatus Omnitrophota bacterium]